jgi:phasin
MPPDPQVQLRPEHQRRRETTMTKTPYEVPTEMREFAEKSVDQARKAFDGFITAAHKATEQVQKSADTARVSAVEAGSKAFAQAEANISAAFDHAQKLVRAKDMSEVMALQTEFVKSQMAALQTQMKDLGENIQKAATSATKAK